MKQKRRARTRKFVLRQGPPVYEPSDFQKHCIGLEGVAQIFKGSLPELLTRLRERGVFYDAPGEIWHNLPVLELIKAGYFELRPILINGSVGLDYLESVLDGTVDPHIAMESKGRTGLRIVGGSQGDVLFRLHTYAEHQNEWFDFD